MGWAHLESVLARAFGVEWEDVGDDAGVVGDDGEGAIHFRVVLDLVKDLRVFTRIGIRRANLRHERQHVQFVACKRTTKNQYYQCKIIQFGCTGISSHTLSDSSEVSVLREARTVVVDVGEADQHSCEGALPECGRLHRETHDALRFEVELRSVQDCDCA